MKNATARSDHPSSSHRLACRCATCDLYAGQSESPFKSKSRTSMTFGNLYETLNFSKLAEACIIIMSCLQRQSATAPHISILHFRNVVYAWSLSEMCAAYHDNVSGRMWLRRTYRFCSPGSPTDVSLPGWRPVPSALGWRSAMDATAACDHSGVVRLGGCCISLDCYRFVPTVLTTSRHGNETVSRVQGGYSRAGGDGGCVADL